MTNAPLNFHTFHRDHSRHSHFASGATHDPFFDQTLGAWIVTDASHCRDLLGSRLLAPAAYAEKYDALEKRLGLDFPNISFALNHVPFCLNGERHAQSRLHGSAFLARRRSVLLARIPALAQQYFGQLRSGQQLDLMADAIVPFVHEIISTIVDVDIGSNLDCANVSLIFDNAIGVSKRRRIEAEVGKLRQSISAQLGDDADDDEIGMLLAFVIVGRDALIGTLGESLSRILRDNSERRLSEIDFPATPPETGVPIIERSVSTAFNLAGCDFKPGDRVRCYLQSFGYGENRNGFFGTGAHACLGRPLSIATWKAVCSELSHIRCYAGGLSSAPRTSDYVFACPEFLTLELYE